MSLISYEIMNEIGVIRLNNPPVNALSHAIDAFLTTVKLARYLAVTELKK